MGKLTEIEETAVETHEEWAQRKRRESMRVTRFQGKAALLHFGLLDTMEQFVDSSVDPLVKLAWAEAAFERLSGFVSTAMAALDITAEQMDAMFDYAATVR